VSLETTIVRGKKPVKPLGGKAYGSIPHLIGSRRGTGDHGVEQGQHVICTERCRPGDRIIVQEKLDGSCVGIARIGEEIIPLIRAGYRAKDSDFVQHHIFHAWAMKRENLWKSILKDGERIVGEWLAQVHGTRYALGEIEPFAPFDIFSGGQRVTFAEFNMKAVALSCRNIRPPLTIWNGSFACSVERAMDALGAVGGHRNDDPVEGAVWRVERDVKVDFLAKYVRPEKIDGEHLPVKSGKAEIWNWKEQII
jgi:hypothetical protein